jgi:4'-phosphopantetheinyl transferase
MDAVSAPDWSRFHTLLDAAERGRAARFMFETHRRQYTVAHTLKRLMLSAVSGHPPRSWTFATAQTGKPYINQIGAPRFSIAHCETLVACAVSAEFEVGIDVEPLTRVAPIEFATAYFAEPEHRWIQTLPPSDRERGFLRLWTLKEAFVKATGTGLSQPLNHFSFEFEPLRVRFHDARLGSSSGWSFEQHEINGSILALAWNGGLQKASVELHEKTLGSLLVLLCRAESN